MEDNERGDSMAHWSFKQLESGEWGAKGYFPKGENIPQDEEILGAVKKLIRKNGSSSIKRITGIEGWFKAEEGWSSVHCEFEDAETANPNLYEIDGFQLRIALVDPNGGFVGWLDTDWWQAR